MSPKTRTAAVANSSYQLGWWTVDVGHRETLCRGARRIDGEQHAGDDRFELALHENGHGCSLVIEMGAGDHLGECPHELRSVGDVGDG